MKRWETVYVTAYWTAAAVLALVWLAYRLPACAHVSLALLFVAGGLWAVRRIAELDRQFKKRRRHGP
jgi:uncharacterized membrane protein YqjE